MKTHISAAAAVAALSALLLSGCASESSSIPTPSTGFVSSIPKPDAAQEARLLSELAKIKPELANDKAVDNARNQCHGSILGGGPEDRQIESAKARFADANVKVVSDSEARQIIAVIKTNGFCKAAE